MNLKGFIHRVLNEFFNPFFTLYCRAKKLHPLDCSCFPVFYINCVGCFGCCLCSRPPLGQKRSKGPWKVALADTFKEQYTELFGKTALVDLMWRLDKHNEEIDEDEGCSP